MARAALEMAPDLTQDVWKEGLGPAAKAFCKALLHKDPSKRLGSNGVKDILDHAFFGGKGKSKGRPRTSRKGNGRRKNPRGYDDQIMRCSICSPGERNNAHGSPPSRAHCSR